MMIIDEITVDDDIAAASFSCDLKRCKGGCCTLEGGRGAPLLDEEVALLNRYYPLISTHLSPENRAHIGRYGMSEGIDGNHATTCIAQRDCVFVVHEGKIAHCAIEKCYLAGEIPWRKPLSCHLFPLRHSSGVLRYERIDECRPGRELGIATGRSLREFAGDALVRMFGRSWYDKFLARCTARDQRTECGEHLPFG